MNNINLIKQVSDRKSIGRNNDGKYLLFDHTVSNGHPYTPYYDYMALRDDGKIDIQLKDSWGLMDPHGRILVYPRFSKPLIFEDGLSVVQDSRYDLGHLGVVDSNGFELVPAIYDDIEFIEEYVLNEELWFYEDKVAFIFGCIDDGDFITHIGHGSGYKAHLREDNGVELFLRNGKVISGKYECFYVTYDRQFIFAGYKGFKIIGYDGDRKEYIKRYEGYYDLINKEGTILLKKICDFIYNSNLKAVKIGFEDTKWAFLNKENKFITNSGDFVPINEIDETNKKLTKIYWPMTSEEFIDKNLTIIANICKIKDVDSLKDEMKRRTIWMTDEDYENEPYPSDNYDPYQYSDRAPNEEFGIMDALDGEPDAYWNIDK